MRTLLPAIALLMAAGSRGAHAQTDAGPSPLLLTTSRRRHTPAS